MFWSCFSWAVFWSASASRRAVGSSWCVGGGGLLCAPDGVWWGKGGNKNESVKPGIGDRSDQKRVGTPTWTKVR